jgi:hypothetical protein
LNKFAHEIKKAYETFTKNIQGSQKSKGIGNLVDNNYFGIGK